MKKISLFTGKGERFLTGERLWGVWLVLSSRRGAHLITERLQSARTPIKANVSTRIRHRLMVVSQRSLLRRCLVRGECERQWPGAKVSSVPVPIWGPSACQSHILITNIIWIYTNEYKWLPGLHKLRVINCFLPLTVAFLGPFFNYLPPWRWSWRGGSNEDKRRLSQRRASAPLF